MNLVGILLPPPHDPLAPSVLVWEEESGDLIAGTPDESGVACRELTPDELELVANSDRFVDLDSLSDQEAAQVPRAASLTAISPANPQDVARLIAEQGIGPGYFAQLALAGTGPSEHMATMLPIMSHPSIMHGQHLLALSFAKAPDSFRAWDTLPDELRGPIPQPEGWIASPLLNQIVNPLP